MEPKPRSAARRWGKALAFGTLTFCLATFGTYFTTIAAALMHPSSPLSSPWWSDYWTAITVVAILGASFGAAVRGYGLQPDDQPRSLSRIAGPAMWGGLGWIAGLWIGFMTLPAPQDTMTTTIPAVATVWGFGGASAALALWWWRTRLRRTRATGPASQ